jgi:hypothetical protein
MHHHHDNDNSVSTMATNTASEFLMIDDRDLDRNKSPHNANPMLLTEQSARR